MVSNDQLAAFHRKQLDGIDWRTAAIDLDLIYEGSGDYMVTSEPDPYCPCDTCRSTKWEE